LSFSVGSGYTDHAAKLSRKGRPHRVGPGNFTPSRLTDPDVNLSTYPALAIANAAAPCQGRERCASRRRLRNGRDSLAEFERDFPGTESLIVENLRVRTCSIASLGCNSEIASKSGLPLDLRYEGQESPWIDAEIRAFVQVGDAVGRASIGTASYSACSPGSARAIGWRLRMSASSRAAAYSARARPMRSSRFATRLSLRAVLRPRAPVSRRSY
jgi:hypothetical protein